jgi:hypothetical protein
MARWNVACDTCDASAWIGTAAGGTDAWCEACQIGAAAVPEAARCARCGGPLTTSEPRFIEIFGELQNLAAVLSAWQGDPAPLAALLPERPRFLSDRTPPEIDPGDPEWLREGLAALAHGDFAVAATQLAKQAPPAAEARRRRAFAIALERRGDAAGAERVLEDIRGAGETPALLLERGTLRARRGDLARASEDFARAGDGYEARWNRAAIEVYEAVGEAGAPDAARLEAARHAAGEPSSAWSDHTVGRLLWTLLIERAARHGALDPQVLRDAEGEFEFASFWDRAAVIEGWARLGRAEDAARLAAPLAFECAAALAEQPGLRGASDIAAVLGRAAAAIQAGQPSEARQLVRSLMERGDLSHYRVPCRACGRGTVGIAEFVDDQTDDATDIAEASAAPGGAREGA